MWGTGRPHRGGLVAESGIRQRLHRLHRLSNQRRDRPRNRRRPFRTARLWNTIRPWEIHRSASKHGVETDDVLPAVAHALVVADMGDDTSRRCGPSSLGPDRSGNMLEVIVLHFDGEREMVIHAIAMRAHYRGLFPRPPETRP